MIRICEKCGLLYNPAQKIRGGYIHHCNSCSKETTERYVGRCTGEGKGGDIHIFRTNIKAARAQILAEAWAGPRPCLPVSSPVVQCIKQGEKEEDD